MEQFANYQEALKKLEEATQTAESIVAQIRTAAETLRNWKRAMVANVSGADMGFPPELMGAPTIDARRWPTADQIARALSAFHTANYKVRSTWEAIPEESRRGLMAPPK